MQDIDNSRSKIKANSKETQIYTWTYFRDRVWERTNHKEKIIPKLERVGKIKGERSKGKCSKFRGMGNNINK